MPGNSGCASVRIARGSRPSSTYASDYKPAPADSLAPDPSPFPAPNPLRSAGYRPRGPGGPNFDRTAPSTTAHYAARPWRPQELPTGAHVPRVKPAWMAPAGNAITDSGYSPSPFSNIPSLLRVTSIRRVPVQKASVCYPPNQGYEKSPLSTR